MSASRLPVSAWPLAARMAIWRVTLPVAKRVVATDRLVRALEARRERRRDPAREETAVRLAGRLWRSSDGPCLERSIALYRELGRMGADPVLVLGVRATGGGEESHEGHAWVEVDGRALLERYPPERAWSPVVRYPRASADRH